MYVCYITVLYTCTKLTTVTAITTEVCYLKKFVGWVGWKKNSRDLQRVLGDCSLDSTRTELLVLSALSLTTLPASRSCRLSNSAASLSGSFQGPPFMPTNPHVHQRGKDAHTESCPQASLRLLIPMGAKTTPWFFPVGTLPLSFLFSFLPLFES
jgi:hypothetical protein